MTNELPEATRRLTDASLRKVVQVIGGFARGTLYMIALIFFSHIAIFATELINKYIPIPSDKYHAYLINGLSLLSSTGALIWFAAYTLQDLIISILYGVFNKGKD